jgi:tetratricopeptide (TPR) repeat protein
LGITRKTLFPLLPKENSARTTERNSQVTLEQLHALAVQHHVANRFREAEALYRQILSVDPNHADSLQMLGGIAFLANQYPQALELIRRAIAINPNAPDYHSNLAIVLAATGQPDAAIASLRHALAMRPNHPDALYNS